MSMGVFAEFEYQPQDAENEVLLSEMPLQVIMTSIEGQFNNPLEYDEQDFLQGFITRYMLTKENIETDEDKEELENLYDTFITFIESIFKEKLGIGLPYVENADEKDCLDFLHYVYRYFIINIKMNYQNFIRRYIKEHREELAETLPKRKDVSSNSIRQEIDDAVDVAILTNLATVIDMVLTDDTVTVDDFLALSRSKNGDLENDYISEAYDDFDITGNFISQYHKMLSEDFRIEVECRVRNKILKKYRK